MRAIYIQEKKIWSKNCGECACPYESESIKELLSFFAKDKNRLDSLDALCKKCRKNYRIKNKHKELARWTKYYAPKTEARKRLSIRSATRRKYGSAKKQICTCGKAAEEWHHIEYNVDSVVALCSKCHENIS